MNVNLALCLNAAPSMAADGQGARLQLEASRLCHLPRAAPSWVLGDNLLSGERPAGAGAGYRGELRTDNVC